MYQRIFKRLIDVVFAIAILPLWLILLIIVAPLIYIEDGGKVFYLSKRLGKDGKVYNMYKFRTMKMGAKDLRNEDNSTYNAEDDPRLTKVGKWLRKASIDETPQIINVLKNEMSFIGPRPDLPEHLDMYEGDEAKKLMALPGITGYNQAYFRNSCKWKERLKNDIYYVDNLSLWLDIKIFFKTLHTVIFCNGVFDVNSKYLGKDVRGDSFRSYTLPWDSKYFGIRCGKVELTDLLSDEDKKRILDFCKGFDFVTIVNINNITDNNSWLAKETNAFITDHNVRFLKEVSSNIQTRENIIIKSNMVRNKEILKIAKHAFIYSRYFNDPFLPKEQAKNIYSYWTECAFRKKDKYFAIAIREGNIAGYCLFNIDLENETINMELIAVDKRFQGIGVGKSLILGIEDFARKKGIKYLKLGTQMDNAQAIHFYLNLGFKYIGSSTVYHMWKDKEVGIS